MEAAMPAMMGTAMGARGVASESINMEAVTETRVLVADLCRQFYSLGWMTGTSGSISVKVHATGDDNSNRLIVMAPSGVQKERMQADDLYVLKPDGSDLFSPSAKPAPMKPPKITDSCPVFLKAHELRNAGTVIHSHGIESALVTMINPAAKEFRITHMEMIKGITGHQYGDVLVVPIIENMPRESELTQSLEDAIIAYPRSTAVLVRNHGVYLWGDSWISAKTQAECYHYLFHAAIRMHELGINPADPLHWPYKSSAHVVPRGIGNGNASEAADCGPHIENRGSLQREAVVLDIEGTTTPISFVVDVLYPFAAKHVSQHLRGTYDTEETQADIALLRKQAEADIAEGIVGVEAIPADCDKEEVCKATLAYVAMLMSKDRKVTGLKALQGHIWREGYAKGQLQALVYDDVPKAMALWQEAGLKTYIYSSGSREAQRLCFQHTNFGDLRRYLSGYFDTTIGGKREAKSYDEIFLFLGVNRPCNITFATDVLQEAQAASRAGFEAVLVVRPGNAPLPPAAQHGFRVITSLLDL